MGIIGPSVSEARVIELIAEHGGGGGGLTKKEVEELIATSIKGLTTRAEVEAIATAIAQAEVAAGVKGLAKFGTVYGAPVSRPTGTEWTPSATQYTFTTFELVENLTTLSEVLIEVNGKVAVKEKIKLAGEEQVFSAIIVPPGGIVKVTFVGQIKEILSRELL